MFPPSPTMASRGGASRQRCADSSNSAIPPTLACITTKSTQQAGGRRVVGSSGTPSMTRRAPSTQAASCGTLDTSSTNSITRKPAQASTAGHSRSCAGTRTSAKRPVAASAVAVCSRASARSSRLRCAPGGSNTSKPPSQPLLPTSVRRGDNAPRTTHAGRPNGCAQALPSGRRPASAKPASTATPATGCMRQGRGPRRSGGSLTRKRTPEEACLHDVKLRSRRRRDHPANPTRLPRP